MATIPITYDKLYNLYVVMFLEVNIGKIDTFNNKKHLTVYHLCKKNIKFKFKTIYHFLEIPNIKHLQQTILNSNDQSII